MRRSRARSAAGTSANPAADKLPREPGPGSGRIRSRTRTDYRFFDAVETILAAPPLGVNTDS